MNMKKTKTFNIGDKVFAKVKGYPAWPAKIVAENTKIRKYEVTFYGTGEIGNIKAEDLFYYMKNKEQLYKNLKRKDYNDALAEIEAEIKECGTDGDDGTNDNTAGLDESENVKGRKRKRSDDSRKSVTHNETHQAEEISNSVAETTTEDGKSASQVSRSGRVIRTKRFSSEEPEEKRRKPSTEEVPKENKGTKKTEDIPETVEKLEESKEDEVKEDTKIENKNVSAQNIKDEKEKDKEEHVSAQNIKDENEKIKEENVSAGNIEDENEPSKDVNKESKEEIEDDENEQELVEVNVISTEYLSAIVAYAQHVNSNAKIYNSKPIEPRDKLPNEVVLARLPSGKTVGLKYGTSHPKGEFEYERALSDGEEASTILSLKCLVEKGDCKPKDDPNMFIVNPKFPSEDTETLRKDARALERIKTRLNLTKIEANLVECDAKIKGCLGLDKAEPKKALEYLETMVALDVTPLMLKKHPLIVDMVKRLKRYIGNAKEWHLEGEALESFEEDAMKIRAKAEEIFSRFKSLFKISENKSFWDVFNYAVEQFKEDTKDMKENEVFGLYAEPYSRQAFLDRYEEQNDNDPSDDSAVIGKENSPNVVNSNMRLTEEENDEGDETT